MWFLIGIIIIFIIVITWMTKHKGANAQNTVPSLPSDNSPKSLPQSDFERWVSIIKKDKKNIKLFELFGTKAAVLWNDGEDEIEVVCLNSFTNGMPEKGRIL